MKKSTVPPPVIDLATEANDSFHSIDGDIGGDLLSDNRVKMVKFEDEDEKDATGAYGKAAAIKLTYTPNDLKFWFSQVERMMKFSEVKAQFTKLQVLTSLLPRDFLEEVKSEVSVDEDEATATCYKDVKKRVMELFGPQEDEDYYKACNLILVTTPSALCRKIIALLCEHRTKPLAQGNRVDCNDTEMQLSNGYHGRVPNYRGY